MAESKTTETDQLRWNATEVETPRMSWALTEPTSGLDAPAAVMTSRKKKEIAFFERARDGRRGDTKRRWQRSQRSSPVKINAERPYRAKQEVVIKTSRKVRQGLDQEGARDGTSERLRLGNKLRNVRETGITTNKGHNRGKSLQLPYSFGRG